MMLILSLADPVVLHDEVLNIMIAGRDTVSEVIHCLAEGDELT